MSFVVARWIVGVFTCISMVHLYWAAGGKLGSLAAIPQLPGEFARGPKPAFKPSALATFLVALGLNPRLIAVEYNGEILHRQRWETTQIHPNDRLEIVTIVGGG